MARFGATNSTAGKPFFSSRKSLEWLSGPVICVRRLRGWGKPPITQDLVLQRFSP